MRSKACCADRTNTTPATVGPGDQHRKGQQKRVCDSIQAGRIPPAGFWELSLLHRRHGADKAHVSGRLGGVDEGLATGMPIVLSKGSTLGDRGPVFSPDGAKIAFWAWDTAYRATLWIADADGSHLKQLTATGYDMYPQWSPDGTRLLFESHRSGNAELWTLRVAE